MSKRQIRAAYDDEGIWVYQAFRPETVAAALELGTFGKGFSLDRMTWIKPSFGWMLYRSGYARKHRQEAILKIKLSHEGFRTILGDVVLTTWDLARFETEAEWQAELKRSEVRCQWDPDRDLHLRRLDRRAIQLGIRGSAVRRYVEEWIVGLEEVTELAHGVEAAVRAKTPVPPVPQETVYTVDREIEAILGI